MHPELVAERQPGGRLNRALERNRKLREVLQRSRQPLGNYDWTAEILLSCERIFRKAVQGLYFGLYERLLPSEHVNILLMGDRRNVDPGDLVIQLRPPSLHDITDQPFSEIGPSSWHSREPVFIFRLQPVSGGPPVNRLFRLSRETPVEWITIQPDVFRYAFVKHEDQGIACVMELWETIVVAASAPWPEGRGPMRRGRNNPISRDDR